jgi:hypothetical protein
MFRFILLAIGIWVLYKLIFEFIIPVYRSTKVMRSKFREMHDHMQNQMNQTNQNKNNYTDPSESANRTQPPQGDYIEFEEIKE